MALLVLNRFGFSGQPDSLDRACRPTRVLPLRHTPEEETLVVQTSNAYCEREEVSEQGALKCCEPDVVWEGNSVGAPPNWMFSLENRTERM